MDVECLPYKKTGYFSKLITDYLDEKKSLRPFYNRFPRLAEFEGQIQEKKVQYTDQHRSVLTEVLATQYAGYEVSDITQNNLTALKDSNTFTIVTGHQLNLFTGPLYFLYKIISAINLCSKLAEAYPKYNFVPVYWMATEDHDFDEINYFNIEGKKIQWNKVASGAVGRLDTKGLEEVFKTFNTVTGDSRRANDLLGLFRRSYLEYNNLTAATRYLANSLFGDYGLVIIDGDDLKLKKLNTPYIKADLFDRVTHTEVTETIAKWNESTAKYKAQVNPREINYFYLKDDLRERIEEQDGGFTVVNTSIRFTKDEMIAEIEKFPERFSPNVITRPVFQEVVLPNLCYIGGGAEIGYWLELKSSFDMLNITFPILLLRNSGLIISLKQRKKLDSLGLSLEDVFMNQNSFINKKIREISNIHIDLSAQKNHLQEQFKDLYKVAELTDKSFLGAVKAQEVKQLKGIDHLEKRLLKAQRRKLKDHVIRMTDLQNQLFPNQSLQERQLNFSDMYLEHGPDLIPKLMEALEPLDLQFTIVKF